MRRLGMTVPAGLAALALAACGGGQEAPQAEDVTAASWSDPDAPEGISVGDGRLTLPAVGGNPGAVYFIIRNQSDAEQTIASASVTGAGMAMLHETVTQSGQARMRGAGEVPVPAGGTVAFTPGGLHVMAMDIGGMLEEGAETEVTLTFTSGDKVSFPVTILGPGSEAAVGPGKRTGSAN